MTQNLSLSKKNTLNTRVISITSGKGGVGKTHTSINVAVALSQQNKKVLLVDGDLGLANVDIMLGIKSENTIYNFLKGECSLDNLLVRFSDMLYVVPAASGVANFSARLSMAEKFILKDGLENLAQFFDYILIDTQAGISDESLFFSAASSEVIIVVTPEPTSLADSYAVIKILAKKFGEKEAGVVVNCAPIGNLSAGITTFERLASVADHYLGFKLQHIATIPSESFAYECITSRRPLVLQYPGSPGGRALINLSKKLDKYPPKYRPKGSFQLLFNQILDRSAC
jgi:flagellar biosynthesis protein FlhG